MNIVQLTRANSIENVPLAQTATVTKLNQHSNDKDDNFRFDRDESIERFEIVHIKAQSRRDQPEGQ